MRNNVILLTAVKESGKTTSFDLIKKNAAIMGIQSNEVVEMMLARKLKDTVAEVFNLPIELMDDPSKNDEGVPVREIPFATPLILTEKHIQHIVSLFGFKEAPTFTYLHTGKKLKHVREALQYIGTEVLREYDEEVHCNAAIRVMSENPNGKLFVVTDGRFPNEFDFFTKRAFTVGIIRDEKISASKERINAGNEHKSEIYVPELIERCEFKIDNNGTIENLEKNIVSFLRVIKG
jgi:hypothetical protein